MRYYVYSRGVLRGDIVFMIKKLRILVFKEVGNKSKLSVIPGFSVALGGCRWLLSCKNTAKSKKKINIWDNLSFEY